MEGVGKTANCRTCLPLFCFHFFLSRQPPLYEYEYVSWNTHRKKISEGSHTRLLTVGRKIGRKGKKYVSVLKFFITSIEYFCYFKKQVSGTSLLIHWLRVCPPMQGTQVWVLVWEDSTCYGATKNPWCRNYWSPHTLEAVLSNKRSQSSEKPSHHC